MYLSFQKFQKSLIIINFAIVFSDNPSTYELNFLPPKTSILKGFTKSIYN